MGRNSLLFIAIYFLVSIRGCCRNDLKITSKKNKAETV